MTWLAIFFGGALKRVVAWLPSLSFWQFVSLILAIIAIIQHFERTADKRHATKVEAQLTKERDSYKSQLDSISTAKNEQKVVTQTRIVTVVQHIKDADKAARVVESAPPAPGCRTNSAVMGADV
jgi:type III secretory pathway component EscV